MSAAARGKLIAIGAKGDLIGHVGAALHLKHLFARLRLPKNRRRIKPAGGNLFSVFREVGKNAVRGINKTAARRLERGQLTSSRYVPEFDGVAFGESEKATA